MAKVSTEGDSVFRASLPTKDVFSTDITDFAAHSGFDYPKMEESLVGSLSYEFTSAPDIGEFVIETVTHNFGYMPMSLAYLGDIGGIPSDSFAILPIEIYPHSQGNFAAYTTTTEFKIVANVKNVLDQDWLDGRTYYFKYQIWTND